MKRETREKTTEERRGRERRDQDEPNLVQPALEEESTSKAPERPRESKERPADRKGKFRRGTSVLSTCGSSVSNTNPSPCNLAHLQTACAQSPQHCAKDSSALGRNSRLTSESAGEGPGRRNREAFKGPSCAVSRGQQ